MSEVSCPGYCCVVIQQPGSLEELQERVNSFDQQKVVDMLKPISFTDANHRVISLGSEHQFLDPTFHNFKCKHWNEETRLCNIYSDRPAMCRDFPNGTNTCPYCGLNVSGAISL